MKLHNKVAPTMDNNKGLEYRSIHTLVKGVTVDYLALVTSPLLYIEPRYLICARRL
jgi:hypothetical protein